jgi:hypothetical protein
MTSRVAATTLDQMLRGRQGIGWIEDEGVCWCAMGEGCNQTVGVSRPKLIHGTTAHYSRLGIDLERFFWPHLRSSSTALRNYPPELGGHIQNERNRVGPVARSICQTFAPRSVYLRHLGWTTNSLKTPPMADPSFIVWLRADWLTLINRDEQGVIEIQFPAKHRTTTRFAWVALSPSGRSSSLDIAGC